MLIDSLAKAVLESGAAQEVWRKLDAGEDAALGVAASARPFMAALRFAAHPQPMLVILPGEDAVDNVARSIAAYLGNERVCPFPQRSDYPFAPKVPDARQCALRAQAAWALQAGEHKVVVASGASLVRAMPPHEARVYAPLDFRAGSEPVDMATGEALSFEDVTDALVARGFENGGDAASAPGTFCVRGGVIDVFGGTVPYPVRLDFFGDEVDEIRRIVPTTGQTIATLPEARIFPVREYRFGAKGVRRATDVAAKRAAHDPVWREPFDKPGNRR